MGGIRDSLEHALQTAWNAGDLAVYGDLLQGDNDPRGELIALDLAPADDDPAWWARREEVLTRWLGAELAARAGPLVQHGFVHEVRHGSVPADLLESPAGAYLRGFSVWGDSTRIGHALAQLASRPRPWLRRLTLACWGGPPVAPAVVDALTAATPRLDELHLAGAPVVRAFGHPALRRVSVDEAAQVAFARDDIVEVRRRSSERPTGWLVAVTDRQRLVELVGDRADCNQLYAEHGATFEDPLPALLARADAAGVVELAGPIVRRADSRPRGDDESYFLQRQPVGHVHVDVGIPPEQDLGSLREHGKQLQQQLATHPLHAAPRAALVEYIQTLQSLAEGDTPLARQRTLKAIVLPLTRAVHGLVESRGWLGAPGDRAWESIETLAAMLALPLASRRVQLRRG